MTMFLLNVGSDQLSRYANGKKIANHVASTFEYI